MDDEITGLPAHALAEAIRTRRLSCRELMQATLARIALVNPRHNALVSLRDGDELLREAQARDEQLARGQAPMGTLHGLPLAIKDTVATAGLRTTLGSPLLRDHIPAEDGLLAARMKAAGCIVIGKSNVPEFALGSHSFNEVFGSTGNAYDPTRSAGGSSGGAAVALAMRMVSLADGSDFMGSLRNPAGWNNVFGFRPSQGRVPMWPAADQWVTQLSTEGPMARTVRDTAMLLDVQAGPDPRAPLSLESEGQCFAERLDAPVQGLRIGWLGDLGGHLAMEPGVLKVCEQALRRLADLGVGVEAIAPGFSPEAVWQDWLVWRRWLVAGRLAPYLKQRPENRAQIKPEALWEYEQGASLSAAEALAASVGRTRFHQQFMALFERVDFLALPSAQVWPFAGTERWPQRIAGREMDTYHRWMEVTIYATLAGAPAISVPAGFSAEGLPMGLQLIGRPRADAAVLQLAQAYEAAAQAVLQRRPDPVGG